MIEPGKICSDLVALKSENPPGDTSGPIRYIKDFLDARGILSDVICSPGGRCNLVTRGEPRPLMLCGHVDVVPAQGEGWTHPPYSGTMEGGYIWGRGSSDMKGGIAAILSACDALLEQGESLPATLVFVCDEETGGENGIRFLLEKNLLSPCDCLIAEPSPALHPCIGQKGLCRLDLRFTGTPGHGSLYPLVGVSAVMEAMHLLEYIRGLHEQAFPVDPQLREIIQRSSDVFAEEFGIEKGTEILERISYNPGLINGGEKVNIVAQYCNLDLELRIPWGCDIHALVRGILAHAPHATVLGETLHEPSLTDPACDFVSVVCREVGAVYGRSASPILQWAASDARHLRAAGFRVIEYGPGELSTLHGTNERVAVAALEKATDIYLRIMHVYGKDLN
ncbi:M20/M25/M40 family metallo-hydrolase [Methanoregula sp.]|uniref:M20/M25/M40 family metallo-hydrolase n=1 Tax=Methanoregula sp. TaxID=2052170 RepID=UPI002CC52AE1|nr:M20/M25/M40 family metallo-hydrolase [Methanoregula sp.]HVP95817.1 M20/M25/M40 family metallo-hydrolase [Methanoregula sp.]